MNMVKREDWQTEPLPRKRTSIALGRTYSPSEFEIIRLGLMPEAMEDKWFIYWDDGALHFHRSWTGFCIYRVHFVQADLDWTLTSADVNGDPEQYRNPNDEEDAALVPFLIDVLLLHKPIEQPDTEPGDASALLGTWSLLGRAMTGEHPSGAGTPDPEARAGDEAGDD